ncbi:hypothetical protein LTR12_014775 [Friedmanniomyces endolithicus]|nr:hypothetical protein LTR75_012517 [Friedmanniomyces endolithicus]KAK0837276.1 hypothetical protein LTR03_012935 [Friedmanniomyces endolithicus]KAK1810854.1 hypothetical protein LTR12_014775 [Friedmanniomyces endolithicus]
MDTTSRKRPAQSPCGPSRTSKTSVLNALRRSSIDQQDRKRTGMHATSNDRTPVSAKATSQRTYIKAICEVLDQHPNGLEKERILEEVGRHCAEWFPDRPLETVRAGLHSTFSVQVKSKDPKIWEWAVEAPQASQDDAASKKRIWSRASVYPQTTARTASAYRRQLSDSPAAGPRLSTTPHDKPQPCAVADARTDSLPTSDKSGTSRRNEILDGNGSMRAQNDDMEQAPLHLWRAAAQDSRLDQSIIALDESANLSQPGDVSTVGHRAEQVVKDPREPGASESVTPHVNTPSHAPSTSPQTGQHEKRASPPRDVESDQWPQRLGEAGSDPQLMHWGKQVRRRKQMASQLKSIRERKATLSNEAESIQHRKEELLGQVAELERQAHKARKQADETERQYEYLQVGAAEADKQEASIETDIRKIDAELLE